MKRSWIFVNNKIYNELMKGIRWKIKSTCLITLKTSVQKLYRTLCYYVTYYVLLYISIRLPNRSVNRQTKTLTESHWISNDETSGVPCKTFCVKVKFRLQRKLVMFCQISKSNLFRDQNLEINQLLYTQRLSSFFPKSNTRLPEIIGSLILIDKSCFRR